MYDPELALTDAENAERVAADAMIAARTAHYDALAKFGPEIPFDAELYALLPELALAHRAAYAAWAEAYKARCVALLAWLRTVKG